MFSLCAHCQSHSASTPLSLYVANIIDIDLRRCQRWCTGSGIMWLRQLTIHWILWTPVQLTTYILIIPLLTNVNSTGPCTLFIRWRSYRTPYIIIIIHHHVSKHLRQARLTLRQVTVCGQVNHLGTSPAKL